jgi:hypothetical protein
MKVKRKNKQKRRKKSKRYVREKKKKNGTTIVKEREKTNNTIKYLVLFSNMPTTVVYILISNTNV